MNNAKLIAALKNAAESLGYSVRSYSGRGMYGSRCVGIDVDRGLSIASVAFRLAAQLVADGEEDVLDDLSYVEWSQDSMGMGAIMYAPSLRWVEESEDEEEEEESDEDAA